MDDFGFDPDLTENVLLPALRPLYDTWFRVEVSGLHNVPDVGGALVVANHSGVIPLDALMTTVALHDHHPAARSLRMLGADLAFATPVVGSLARKAGHTLACNPDAERLLLADEVVGVWPEGFKGVGKRYAGPVQAAAVRPRRVRLGGAADRVDRSSRAPSSAPRRPTR